MSKNEPGNRGKNGAVMIVSFSVFGIMLLMASGLCLSFIDSIRIRNILFGFVCILTAVCMGILMRLVTGNKLSLTAVNVVSGLMFAGVMGSLFFMLFTKAPASMQFMGNNAYAAGYVKGYVGSGCESREECIREALEKRMEEQAGEMDFEEIYRIERGNLTWVFFGGSNDILKFECVLEDNGQYYISGSSALVYHGFFEEPAYSDIETVRSDVANCIRNERWRSDDTPVWGVTKNPKGPELSINGIRADFTLEVKDEEGQSYYFWVIEDIGDVKDAEDIEKLSIEGLL